MRNRLASALAIAATTIASLACEGTATGSMGTAPTGDVRVRLINGLPTSQSLDFLIDGQVTATGVTYGAASPYVSTSVGSHRLQARASVAGTMLVDFTRDLSSQGAFSLIPAPGLNQFGALFITDDPTPVAGQARLRTVHVAAAAPTAVTVFITAPTADLGSSTPAVPTLLFATASDYVQLPPGTYRVRITRALTPNEIVVDLGNVTVGSGSVRTLLVTDAPGGGLPTSLSVVSDGT